MVVARDGGGSDYDEDEDDEGDDGGNRPEPDAPSAGARGANLRLVRERLAYLAGFLKSRESDAIVLCMRRGDPERSVFFS